MKTLPIYAALLCACLAPMAVRADFALRHHDTVVFLGDSITAARGYTKLVEEYTLLRFPERKVRFINAGKGGDTASGALVRLDRDVFGQGATVVTVAFGVNDIGWGMKADAEHKQRYLNGIRGIVQACNEHKVRVFICSPAITAENPDSAEKGFLQSMTDEGMTLTRSLGAGTIDLQRGMREVQRRILEANTHETDPKQKTLLHLDDGIHLNDLGQLAMGYVLLKGLGAPAEVSSVVIDAKTKRVVSTGGCQVSQLRQSKDGVEFVRLDEGLPLNLGMLGALNFRFIPIPDNLNHYMLTVRNLATGEYNIRAEGRVLGQASAKQLQDGLNISSMSTNGWEPGGPWEAQAAVIKELTEARDKIWMSGVLRRQYFGHHPDAARLEQETVDTDEKIAQLQRDAARPYPYHFEIEKHLLPVEPASTNDISIKTNISYGPNLLLDVYLPPDHFARPRPAVLEVHGGGWEGGSRNGPLDVQYSKMLARAGFVVLNIDYRLVKRPKNGRPAENPYPAAFDDCQRAVRWVRRHAGDYSVDPKQIGALGGSAGGHLVALLGTKDTRDNSDAELAAYSSRVGAVVDLCGPTDLTKPFPKVEIFGITVQGMVDNFVGMGNVERQREASPIFAIDAQTPPFLILQGGQDPLVPPDQSRAFHAALKKTGRDSTYMEFPDDGHVFLKPENQSVANQKIIDFFQRTLSKK